jgi:hypothetical protein
MLNFNSNSLHANARFSYYPRRTIHVGVCFQRIGAVADRAHPNQLRSHASLLTFIRGPITSALRRSLRRQNT